MDRVFRTQITTETHNDPVDTRDETNVHVRRAEDRRRRQGLSYVLLND